MHYYFFHLSGFNEYIISFALYFISHEIMYIDFHISFMKK